MVIKKIIGGNLYEDIESKSAFVPQSVQQIGLDGRPSRNLFRFTDAQLLDAYEQNDIVYRCVEKNANRVASIGWGVYRLQKKATTLKGFRGKRLTRKQRQRINHQKATDVAPDSEIVQLTDHPLIDILTTGSPYANGSQLFKLTATWLEIFGRAYWLVEDEGFITPLKPWCVRPKLDADGAAIAYEYRDGTDGQTFDAAKVISFRFISARDPFHGGMSPLMAAMKSVLTSDLYQNWLNSTIANRRRPDWVLIPKNENITPEDIQRAERELAAKVGGPNNGKPLVMSGAFTPVNLSFGPTDLAPLEVQADILKRIAGAHGIPSAIADSDAATYSNYETAMEDWDRSATLPRTGVIDQTLNENLAKLNIDDDVFFAYENPVAEDEEADLQAQTVAVQKVTAGVRILTINEQRELLGFEPLPEGGDELLPAPAPASPFGGNDPTDPTDDPQDDQKPASDEGEAPAAEPEGKAQRTETVLKINAMVAAGTLPRAAAINLVAELLGVDDIRAKGLVGFLAQPKCGECNCGKCHPSEQTEQKAAKPSVEEVTAGKIKTKVRKFFDRIRPQVLQRVKALDLTGYITKGALPDEFVPLDEWTDELADDVKPLIEFGTQKSADGKQREYVRAGASPDVFSVVPQKVKEATDRRAYRFASSTMATTTKTINDAIDRVREQVLQGVLQGDTTDAIAQAVGDVFENATDYQADRIARTEASAATHMGQVIAAKQSGIVKGFRYLVSEDACDVCSPYDGQEIDIDDYDSSGAVDAEGAVPLHPNCTCTLQEILDLDSGGSDDDEVS